MSPHCRQNGVFTQYLAVMGQATIISGNNCHNICRLCPALVLCALCVMCIVSKSKVSNPISWGEMVFFWLKLGSTLSTKQYKVNYTALNLCVSVFLTAYCFSDCLAKNSL